MTAGETALPPGFADLPKAELHLHLEGSISPLTVVDLARRHGATLDIREAAARYQFADFAGFLEAFKWVTSLLRTPEDYALVTQRLVEDLRGQNVIYAEVTLSVGVMLRRRQNVEANFAAIREAAESARRNGLRLQWVFDAVRQFGPEKAMKVARLAAQMKRYGVVAFGMGGDELSLPASRFRHVYDYAAQEGLHRLIHAGEIGGPGNVREAIETLGAERIGHGIAVVRDPALMSELASRGTVLEVCPTSNLRTGALARQAGHARASMEHHPLPELFRRGLHIALSTDDPAMFQTNLLDEYAQATRTGLTEAELVRLAAISFEAAFLPEDEKALLRARFQAARARLNL